MAQNFSRLAVKNGEHTWGVTNRYMNACPRSCNGAVCPENAVGSAQCNPDLDPTANGGVPVDQINWSNDEFHKISYPNPLRKDNPYHLMVQAFANQRALGLDASLNSIAHPSAAATPLAAAVAAEMQALQARPLITTGFASLPLGKLTILHEMVSWAAELSIDASAGGAINGLSVGGRQWAGPNRLLAQLRYESLNEADLEGWRDAFLYENGTSVAHDYGKPNISDASLPHRLGPAHQLVAPTVPTPSNRTDTHA
jgi:hypothetical protein